MKFSGKGRLIFIGLALGCLLAGWPGAFLVFTLALLTCALIRRYTPETDRNFLQWVFLLSLGIRLLLGAANQYFLVESVKTPLLGPDGELYSAGGWYISSLISGARYDRLFSAEFHQIFPHSIKYFDYVNFVYRFEGRYLPPLEYHAVGVFTYGVAFLYSLMGYAPLVLKWLNGFLGSLLPLLGYSLSKRIFTRASAGRVAAVLLALHPTLLIWSTTALRDPLVILSALFFLYSLTRCLEGRWVWAGGLLAGWAGTAPFRPWTETVLWFTVGAGILGWLAARSWRAARGTTAGAAVLLVALAVYQMPAVRDSAVKAVSAWKTGYANRYEDPHPRRYRIFPASVYGKGYAGKMVKRPFTPGEVIHGLGVGLIHFLFLPYPCCVNGSHQAVLSILFLFWYALLPFIFLGYLRNWREDPKTGWFLGIFAMGASVAIASNSVVIGTLIRHRDLVSPLFLVWAAGGLDWAGSRIRRWQERPAGKSSRLSMAAEGV